MKDNNRKGTNTRSWRNLKFCLKRAKNTCQRRLYSLNSSTCLAKVNFSLLSVIKNYLLLID